MDAQLPLFTGAGGSGASRRRRSERLGRNARMALRLDELAEQADAEAEECRRAGDEVGVRRARERARDARRSAAVLRAGPPGVADLLAS